LVVVVVVKVGQVEMHLPQRLVLVVQDINL
jgi:hypothetical protein